MNAALRRRHFRFWLVLLVALPLLVALGLAARPDWPSQAPPADLTTPAAPGAAP